MYVCLYVRLSCIFFRLGFGVLLPLPNPRYLCQAMYPALLHSDWPPSYKEVFPFWRAAPKGLMTYDSKCLSVCPSPGALLRPLETLLRPEAHFRHFKAYFRPSGSMSDPQDPPQILQGSISDPFGPTSDPHGPAFTKVSFRWLCKKKINKMNLEFVCTILLNFETRYDECSDIFRALNSTG